MAQNPRYRIRVEEARPRSVRYQRPAQRKCLYNKSAWYERLFDIIMVLTSSLARKPDLPILSSTQKTPSQKFAGQDKADR